MTIFDRDLTAAPRVGQRPVRTRASQPTIQEPPTPRAPKHVASPPGLPSERRHFIQHGNQQATVVQANGGLRQVAVDSRPGAVLSTASAA